MRNYHPKSWSAQARKLADRIYEPYSKGILTLKDCEIILIDSYKHPLIRLRAAKRFGRLIRRDKK